MIIKNFSKFKQHNLFYNLFNNAVIFFVSALIILGFEPFNYSLITIVAIVIITLYLLQIKHLADVFLKSYLISLSLSMFGFHWIVNSGMYILHSYILAMLLLLGFSILYTAFILPTVYLLYKAPKQGYRLYLSIFVAWIVADMLKQYLFGGLPWYSLGYIWTDNVYILESVAIFGIFGLSVVTVALIVSILYAVLASYAFSGFNYKRFLPLSVMLLIFVALMIFGYLRVHSKNESFTGKVLAIRIVQPNILQADKLNPNKSLSNFHSTMALAFDNQKQDFNYIILPEVAFSFIIEDYPDLYQDLIQAIPPATKLIMGALRESEGKYYNSVYVLNSQGKRLAYYDKQKLVPFGEYIPFSYYLPFIANFVGVSNLTQGSIDNTIILDEFIYNLLICFEGVFNTTNLSVSKLDFILNLSNEAWFDESIEISQNIAMYKVRAIENGVIAIKVSNRGPSVIINSLGQIVQLTQAYNAEVLDTKIKLEKRKTFVFIINSRFVNTLMVILIGLLYIIILRWR